nr:MULTISPECIES: hypothetical protein [unclassified Mesorhizobium]
MKISMSSACAPSASIFNFLSPEMKNVPNGILLAPIAYASYSGSDAVIKSLGGQFTVFEIGFFSTLFACCLVREEARLGTVRWNPFARARL